MEYSYRARTKENRLVSGKLQAAGQEQAVQQLRVQGLVPVALQESGKGSSRGLREKLSSISTVSLKDKSVLFRQLATMISAGVTLGSALTVLVEQTSNKRLSQAVAAVKRQVDSGTSLSAAMRTRKEFSILMISIVKAGEEGGVLDSSLDRLATFLEKQDALRSKIISAVSYPAVVMSFSLLVVYILVTFIVPRFARVFSTMNIELPKITTVTFDFAVWMREKWYVFILGFVFLITGIILLNRMKATKPAMDAFKLKMPVLGDVVYKTIMARTNRTLSALVESGVPILMALEMTSEVAGNYVIASEYSNLREAARRGQGLGETAAKSKVFPLMVSHMITVGEQTGKLEEMLGKVADWFEMELDEKIKRLTSVIEPLLIIFVGGIVALVASAIFLPIVGAIQAML